MDKLTDCIFGEAPAGPTLTHQKQSGFSLIEVLVAIIILSIGMLGAVGMQAAAMQSNKEARNQATATTFARELAEKMRGNKSIAIQTTAKNNPYLLDTLNTPLDPTFTIATANTNCFLNECSAASAVAAWDVADWQGRIQTALPTPRIKVCFDQSPFDISGMPQWMCSNSGDIAILKMGWTRNNTGGTLELASSGIPLVVLPVTAGSSQ